MNPNQVACPRCAKVVLKAHKARHLKTCGITKPTTQEPQRPCPACGVMITLSNRGRHIKKCNPALLKRKAEDPAPPTSKAARMDNDPQPSTSASIIDTVRSAIVSAYNTAKVAVDNLIRRQHLRIEEIETAFQCRMKTYAIINHPNIKDPVGFLQQARGLLRNKIEEHLKEKNIKTNLVLLAEYKKPVGDTEEKKKMNFKTENTIILPTTNIEEYLEDAEGKVMKEMDEFYAKGSGWALTKIIGLELRVNRYDPIHASTYIDLPKKITDKKAVINIQNTDQKCFLWSVLAALHPVSWQDQPRRLHHYLPYEHDFDHYLQGIEFPVTLDHVKLFEKRTGISVNVYAYDDKYIVYPLLVTDNEKSTHIDLLYVKDEENTHYCLIRDLSRLVSNQISKYGHKTYICRRCLLHFGTEDLLNRHKEDCKEHEAVKIIMPEKGTTIKFEDGQKKMRVPFAIYADFECMLTPIEENEDQPIGPKRRYTEKYQKHEAISFCYYTVYTDGDYERPENYFGVDAAQVFVEHLLEESRKIHHLYSSAAAIPMQLTTNDEQEFITAMSCHICEKPFDNPEDYKVRDHDHLTGTFRGAAHNLCNLKFRKPNFIPIFIHNLSGYDTHLFIKMFGLNDETISVVPNNEERYISYTIEIEGGVKLRFLDSCRFMASSLDKLAKNLASDQFKHASKYYTGEQLELLTKKGIYPYDFMDSLGKFELTSLPDKKDFYNKLNMTNITDEDYEHAQKVWSKFNIKNMQEYTLLYNQTDVLLLADIMENFRDVCLQTYKLDPAWYFTSPGLAWSAMLKVTSIELELLSDYNMSLMIGKGIRGGVSQVSCRYAKANNPYTEDYDEEKPTSYLTYLDANNLYGWAMSQAMPYGNFKWAEPLDFVWEGNDCGYINIMDVPDDAEIGYLLEVDLEYPQELHDLHSDLPLAPEQRIPPGAKEKKLLLTLFGKEKYVVHYRNLKQYLSLGMKLTKVHRAVCFNQSRWLKKYIDLNTSMRTQARNDFEKDFFKLMNNSVFGKTMENIRNRVDIRLATKERQVQKWLAKPNFKSRTIFTEQLAAVHMSKTKLLFNKAIYVGMSILDVSKTLMFDFHYNVIKKKYGSKAELQYTDTDSLTYLIETPSFYEDMTQMLDFFDTSDYTQPNRYNIPSVNKKVIGKFKDELNGRVMYEHVGLRSKMYASRSEKKNNDDDGEIKKSKGVKMCVIKKDITFQDYKDCMEQFAERYSTLDVTLGERLKDYGCKDYRTLNMIRSFKHDLYTVELNKIALSAEDDKRFILDGGIKTLPWGHFQIDKDAMLDQSVLDALLAE